MISTRTSVSSPHGWSNLTPPQSNVSSINLLQPLLEPCFGKSDVPSLQEQWAKVLSDYANELNQEPSSEKTKKQLSKLIESNQLNFRMNLALRILRDQMGHILRKDNVTPTASHALGAAAIVAEHHGSNDSIVATLLHDWPEEKNHLVAFTGLFLAFGWQVARMVWTCTDYVLGGYNPPNGEQRTRFLKKIQKHGTPETLHLLLAEKIDGIQSLERGIQKSNSAKEHLQSIQFRSGPLEYQAYMLAISDIASKKLPKDDALVKLFRTEFQNLVNLQDRTIEDIKETNSYKEFHKVIN